jgi:hypothetical protein
MGASLVRYIAPGFRMVAASAALKALALLLGPLQLRWFSPWAEWGFNLGLLLFVVGCVRALRVAPDLLDGRLLWGAIALESLAWLFHSALLTVLPWQSALHQLSPVTLDFLAMAAFGFSFTSSRLAKRNFTTNQVNRLDRVFFVTLILAGLEAFITWKNRGGLITIGLPGMRAFSALYQVYFGCFALGVALILRRRAAAEAPKVRA